MIIKILAKFKSGEVSSKRMECEEPDCTEKATCNWNGRKLCRDHFEHYKEEKEKMLMDLRDID